MDSRRYPRENLLTSCWTQHLCLASAKREYVLPLLAVTTKRTSSQSAGLEQRSFPPWHTRLCSIRMFVKKYLYSYVWSSVTLELVELRPGPTGGTAVAIRIRITAVAGMATRSAADSFIGHHIKKGIANPPLRPLNIANALFCRHVQEMTPQDKTDRRVHSERPYNKRSCHGTCLLYTSPSPRD